MEQAEHASPYFPASNPCIMLTRDIRFRMLIQHRALVTPKDTTGRRGVWKFIELVLRYFPSTPSADPPDQTISYALTSDVAPSEEDRLADASREPWPSMFCGASGFASACSPEARLVKAQVPTILKSFQIHLHPKTIWLVAYPIERACRPVSKDQL